MAKLFSAVLNQAMVKSAEPSLAKSSLAGWIGRTIGLRDSNFWQSFLSAGSSSGKSVTVEKALQLSAVWSCVRLLAETIATLPLNFFERDGEERKAATDHPLYELLHNQPNADMTSVEFWEMVMACLLLRGNAFVEIDRIGKRIASLTPLLPERMSITRRSDGSPKFTYNDDQTGKTREIAETDMWHIKGFGIGGLLGLSPVSYARETLGSAMAADEASGKIFANGMRPSGLLSMEQILNAKQREEVRESLAGQFAGSMNTGKMMVLEAGMKFQQITMNPEDAQMLETRSFNIEEICRWFRVPPVLIGHNSQTTWGSGIEQIIIGFLTFSLTPWFRRIEMSIRRSLLAPGERNRFFAEFSAEGLLRADSSARAAFFSTMAQNGGMTRNEFRKKENLPPLPGGDILTVQSNLVPLDQLGKADIGQGAAKSALRQWLGITEQEDPACSGKAQS